MRKSLILLLTAGLMAAGPAAADGVTISLAGKTPQQIDTEINQAARKVCREAAATPLDSYTTCVRVAVADAKAQADAAAKLQPSRLASSQ